MKIPTSSSILFATLAISSSSSCLAAAAPIGDDTGMTSSSSSSRISSFLEGSAPRAYPAEMDVQERSETVTEETLVYPRHLETRDLLMDGVVPLVKSVPIVGPPLANIITSALGVVKGVAGVKSMDVEGTTTNINPQDMEALQSAISELSRLLNTTAPGLPLPGQDNGGATLPIASPLSYNDSATDSSLSYSATPTETAAAAASDGATPDGSSSATYSSASASPSSSPPLPINPPNSPISPPALPVNV